MVASSETSLRFSDAGSNDVPQIVLEAPVLLAWQRQARSEDPWFPGQDMGERQNTLLEKLGNIMSGLHAFPTASSAKL